MKKDEILYLNLILFLLELDFWCFCFRLFQKYMGTPFLYWGHTLS